MDASAQIFWNYIDTHKATIKVMEDYKNIKKLESILPKEKNSNDKNFRLQKVREFLSWFEPAWDSLEKEKKMIRKEFYMNESLKSGAGIKLQFKLNYSERQIHRLKDKSISELALLLFGK